jgi:hypothetical protein
MGIAVKKMSMMKAVRPLVVEMGLQAFGFKSSPNNRSMGSAEKAIRR